jgi:hypothetical protein
MLVLVGSISSLGAHYALSLNAMNCLTGEPVSRQEAEVESREKILQAVDRISTKTRETLGESLSSIQKYDVPLDQATTSSLEGPAVFPARTTSGVIPREARQLLHFTGRRPRWIRTSQKGTNLWV